MRTAVCKVGGSLYDLPDLPARLTAALAAAGVDRPLLFPGGGAAADLVRSWQPRFQLGETSAHWLAVRALEFNAALLQAVVPGAVVVQRPAEAAAIWELGGVPILAPLEFLRQAERQAYDEAPPHVWDVTSDSLAAWTALRWRIETLVLFKSAPLPAAGCLATSAAAQGLVDAYFPGLAGRLPHVAWCDLRAPQPHVVPWLHAGAPPTT